MEYAIKYKIKCNLDTIRNFLLISFPYNLN